MNRTLKAISFVLHPQFTFPAVLLMPFLAAGLWQQYFVVLLISFVLPFAYFLNLYFSGKVKDWDVTERRQRYALYSVALLGLALAEIYIAMFSTDFIFFEYVKISILAIIIVLLNFKIKVSLHVGMLTILCFSLVQYFDWSYWIFLLMPLLAYSRVMLKKHKVIEVILGAGIPVAFYFVLNFF